MRDTSSKATEPILPGSNTFPGWVRRAVTPSARRSYRANPKPAKVPSSDFRVARDWRNSRPRWGWKPRFLPAHLYLGRRSEPQTEQKFRVFRAAFRLGTRNYIMISTKFREFRGFRALEDRTRERRITS